MDDRHIPIPPGFEEALEKTRRREFRKIRASDLVQRRASCTEKKNVAITTAADAIAERDLHAYAMIAHPEYYEMAPGVENLPEPERTKRHDFMLWSVASAITVAQVFIWKIRVLRGALAMTLPEHIFGEEGWPYSFMWWMFEWPIPIPDLQLKMHAMMLARKDDSVVTNTVLSYNQGHSKDGTMVISGDRIRFGEKIIEDEDTPPGDNRMGMLKLVAFLNSKYVGSDPQRMDRATRRALIRADQPEAAEETVRVVDLRTPETMPHEPGDGEGIDWQSRWWVRGHIRAQWCPSSESHKLIWIAPYLKGPEDKPIAEKVYRVVR